MADDAPGRLSLIEYINRRTECDKDALLRRLYQECSAADAIYYKLVEAQVEAGLEPINQKATGYLRSLTEAPTLEGLK